MINYSMTSELVFFTGAPGSKWSGSANILQAIRHLNFNTTDRSPEREYTHTGPTPLARSITHTGVYFGPGHGFGEDFHRLSELDPREVEAAIRAEWQDPSWGKLLVKSHFFTESLDYIADTWPNNPIIMIQRPNHKCEQGWFGAGGWSISYPDYLPYYKDDDTMRAMIAQHNDKIDKFCAERGIVAEPLTAEYLERVFGWTVDQIEDEVQREWVYKHLIHTEGTKDVTIAIWNLEKL